jgi:hypothetical protein
VLATSWGQFCGNPHNNHATMATVREWFTARLRELAPNEAQRMRALRVQIATELVTNLANYQAAIDLAIATMIDAARFENDDVHDPLDWHFEGAGGLFGDVLAVFVAQNLPAVLDYDTDIETLVAGAPLLTSAYIAAMRDDVRLWTGEAEILALDAIRGAMHPIQVFLPSTMPLAAVSINVEEALRVAKDDEQSKSAKSGKSDPSAKSAKSGKSGKSDKSDKSDQPDKPSDGPRIDAPKFEYSKMSNAGSRDVLLDDAANILGEHDWIAKGHICEYRAALPYGIDLHASLVGKSNDNGFINQVEFVIREVERDKGKERKTSVRWWYWIKLLDDEVRLAFSGNVGGGADAAIRQAQSDENESAYARFLAGTGLDPGTLIADAVAALERGLTAKRKSKGKK